MLSPNLSAAPTFDDDSNVTPLTDTAPALVGSFVLTPAIFSSKETVDDVLAAIRAEADKFIEVRDISTPAGRAAIASFAHSKIAKSKTALDALGKTVKEEAQEKVYRVDDERRRIREFLDALRDEVRAPLTEWEEADRKRIAAHEAALLEVRDTAVFAMFAPTGEMVLARMSELSKLRARNWEEFTQRAERAASDAATKLDKLLGEAVQRKQERAAREAAERIEAERLQREHEERIAREAREAAERKAEQEKEELRRQVEFNRREIERRAREEEERQAAAEQAQREIAERIERDRVSAHETALATMHAIGGADPARSSSSLLDRQADLDALFESRDWHEFADQARQVYTDAHSALTGKIARARSREEDDRQTREAAIAREARAAELKRQHDELEAAEAEQAKRETNKRIRNRVRRQIAEAIERVMLDNLNSAEPVEPSEALAEALIAGGKIPHATVTF